MVTLFFQCFANKLGTEMFAIHGVCYAVSVLMESYTNGLHTFTVNRLSKVRGVTGKYKSHLWIIKRYGSLVLLLVAVSIMPSLFLLHGSVPFASCIPFVFVYCLHTVSLVMYETSGACLISMQKTDILKFDGVVGIAIRIPAVLLLY